MAHISHSLQNKYFIKPTLHEYRNAMDLVHTDDATVKFKCLHITCVVPTAAIKI